MAKGKPTQLLIANTTAPRQITIEIESDEAHENEIANYIRIAAQQGQIITRSIFLKHAEQHILKNDRLYKQLAGKIKPRKKPASTSTTKSAPKQETTPPPISTVAKDSRQTPPPTTQQSLSNTPTQAHTSSSLPASQSLPKLK